LSWARGEALKRLREQPVDRAIRETDAAFPELGGVAEALRAWSEHDSFAEAWESYLGGQRELVDVELVRSFINSTSFHHPEDTERWASNVLIELWEIAGWNWRSHA